MNFRTALTWLSTSVVLGLLPFTAHAVEQPLATSIHNGAETPISVNTDADGHLTSMTVYGRAHSVQEIAGGANIAIPGVDSKDPPIKLKGNCVGATNSCRISLSFLYDGYDHIYHEMALDLRHGADGWKLYQSGSATPIRLLRFNDRYRNLWFKNRLVGVGNIDVIAILAGSPDGGSEIPVPVDSTDRALATYAAPASAGPGVDEEAGYKYVPVNFAPDAGRPANQGQQPDAGMNPAG